MADITQIRLGPGQGPIARFEYTRKHLCLLYYQNCAVLPICLVCKGVYCWRFGQSKPFASYLNLPIAD